MEGPTTSLTFLGIELGTMQQALRLLDNKLADLRTSIAILLQRQKVSLEELQQIVGHLNFACSVVAPGQAFLR